MPLMRLKDCSVMIPSSKMWRQSRQMRLGCVHLAPNLRQLYCMLSDTIPYSQKHSFVVFPPSSRTLAACLWDALCMLEACQASWNDGQDWHQGSVKFLHWQVLGIDSCGLSIVQVEAECNGVRGLYTTSDETPIQDTPPTWFHWRPSFSIHKFLLQETPALLEIF